MLGNYHGVWCFYYWGCLIIHVGCKLGGSGVCLIGAGQGQKMGDDQRVGMAAWNQIEGNMYSIFQLSIDMYIYRYDI
jgi:hypothetical protein